jgi:DNA polymerase I-like protein with 3'-5' exonuclease and polymerase domains
MALFSVKRKASTSQDKAVALKSKTSQKATTLIRGGSSLLGRINQIRAVVEKNLGQFKDDYVIIRTEEDLDVYFQQCTLNGVVAIDTETTGLDPILDSIVGLCLYTPNQPAAYVPINHTSYVTGARVDNQLTEKQVADRLFALLQCNPAIIMFNAKFDMRVIRNQLGVKDIYCTWDTYLAARLMNENEESNRLKKLHNKYVLNGKGDAFSFDELFNGIPADRIPINTFYLYAAHDAIITYELYQYQKQFVYYDATQPNEARNGMNGVSWVFFNIEMPCIKVVCDMEDNGIKFDFDYNQFLKDKYHALLEDRVKQFNKICDTYAEDIEAYRRKVGVNCKLDNPINIKSSTQLAILLYDIMGCEVPVDKKTKKEVRTTNEATLKSMDNPVAKAVLDYREFSTIVDTFIDKLPDCVNPKDGRIHCSFNQYGARTGRMSSENPNLQNIPSHNKEIRKMFVATNETVEVTESDNSFIVGRWSEVNTVDGWKYADSVVVGDKLLVEENGAQLEIIVSRVDIVVDKNQIVYYH